MQGFLRGVITLYLSISQGSELATNNHFLKRKGVATKHVDMLMAKRGEPSSIFVAHQEALGPELIERSVHIDGVPEHDDVCCQAERLELIFLSFTITLSQFDPQEAKNRQERQRVRDNFVMRKKQ